eukprot:4899583-Amphidinium_carterae.1
MKKEKKKQNRCAYYTTQQTHLCRTTSLESDLLKETRDGLGCDVPQEPSKNNTERMKLVIMRIS